MRYHRTLFTHLPSRAVITKLSRTGKPNSYCQPQLTPGSLSSADSSSEFACERKLANSSAIFRNDKYVIRGSNISGKSDQVCGSRNVVQVRDKYKTVRYRMSCTCSAHSVRAVSSHWAAPSRSYRCCRHSLYGSTTVTHYQPR